MKLKNFAALAVALVTLAASAALSACGGGEQQALSAAETAAVPAGSGLTAEEKRAVFRGEYGAEEERGAENYSVGRSLNVITGSYPDVSAGYVPVFDEEKLIALDWYRIDREEVSSYAVSAASMSELLAKYGAETEASLSSALGIGIFSSDLSAKFGFSAGAAYESTASEIFYSLSQVYVKEQIAIEGYYDLRTFASALSDGFLSDAAAVQEGEMSPEAFFGLYGTHVLLGGNFGGSLEANYYLRSTSEQWSADFSAGLQARIGTQLGKLFSAEAETVSSVKEELGFSSQDVTEQFSASAVGGGNFKALSLSDVLNNYGAWTESLNGQNAFPNLVSLPERSLAFVADLLPSAMSSAKQRLSDWFMSEAERTESAFLKEYERSFIVPADPGDTVSFAGGFGTAESPYLVSEKAHFRNMAKYPSAHYRLANSLELGIHDEPFALSGTFDGGGFTISYFQTLDPSSDCKGGLFTVLDGATAENLYIDAAIAEGKGDRAVTVGALAGEAKNGARISRIAVSGKINLANGTGIDRVGGIVGLVTGGSISECSNSAQLEARSFNAVVGGIAGYAEPSGMNVTVANCANTGSIKACTAYLYGGRSAGGLLGQVKGHNTFSLTVKDSFSDGETKIVQTANIAMPGAWWGCGGIFGDISSKASANISVARCYWNTQKCTRSGNNSAFHKDNGRSYLSGSFGGWDAAVWIFSGSASPALRWMSE